LQGLIELLQKHPDVLRDEQQIKRVQITIYQPAFGIIGDPAKRDPRTRQSADHSMVYIVATTLKNAFERGAASWSDSMLLPQDYDDDALFHPRTRQLMERIEFRHGGAEYDALYPEGIPTSIELQLTDGRTLSSGLVQFPLGHARNQHGEFAEVLETKMRRLAALGVEDADGLLCRLSGLRDAGSEDIARLYARCAFRE
jgi:2-methylcitrate dehydratase